MKAVEIEADLSSVFKSSFENNPKPAELDVFAGGLLLAGPMLRHSVPPLPAPEMDTLISDGPLEDAALRLGLAS